MDTPEVVCIASWNADLVSRVPRPIARGETLMARSFEISPGGKGSNAAVACARQGARTALIARIGRDDFGRMGLELWQREGIGTQQVQQVEGERSGVAQILVYDDGDNSIAVAPGAGAGLAPSHIEAARSALDSCRVVMASCEVPLAATLAAFRIGRTAGVTTLLNPAPAQPLPDELLALIDVLTPNENELRAVAGVPADASLDAAARVLLERGVRAVIVTLGAAGCRLMSGDRPALDIAGWHIEGIVDTVGAGDTFTGVLAAAIARGNDIERAARRANAAAALSVTGRGAIGGMPSASQVDRQLASSEAPRSS